jgi:hypothetical protein
VSGHLIITTPIELSGAKDLIARLISKGCDNDLTPARRYRDKSPVFAANFVRSFILILHPKLFSLSREQDRLTGVIANTLQLRTGN